MPVRPPQGTWRPLERLPADVPVVAFLDHVRAGKGAVPGRLHGRLHLVQHAHVKAVAFLVGELGHHPSRSVTSAISHQVASPDGLEVTENKESQRLMT